MELNVISKASKLMEKIKSIDSEIINIEKNAMIIMEKTTKTSIDILIDDIDKKEEEKKKVTIDDDGSLIIGDKPNTTGWGFSFIPSISTPELKEEIQNKINIHLTPTSIMQVFGIIIHEKNQQRNRLINQLEKLGFSINK